MSVEVLEPLEACNCPEPGWCETMQHEMIGHLWPECQANASWREHFRAMKLNAPSPRPTAKRNVGPCLYLGPVQRDEQGKALTHECGSCQQKKGISWKPKVFACKHQWRGEPTTSAPICEACEHFVHRHLVKPDDPKCGVVIGAYGMPDMVELNIRCIRHFNGDIPVLVSVDPMDPTNPRAAEVAEKFAALEKLTDVTVKPNHRRLGHNDGDMRAFHKGLLWGRSRGLDVVAKLSMRFMVTKSRWLAENALAVLRSGQAVGSQDCTDKGSNPTWACRMFIRSEFALLNIAKWNDEAVASVKQSTRRWMVGEGSLWDVICRHFGGEFHKFPWLHVERYEWTPDTVFHTVNLPDDYHVWAKRLGVELGPHFTTCGWPQIEGSNWKRNS